MKDTLQGTDFLPYVKEKIAPLDFLIHGVAPRIFCQSTLASWKNCCVISFLKRQMVSFFCFGYQEAQSQTVHSAITNVRAHTGFLHLRSLCLSPYFKSLQYVISNFSREEVGYKQILINKCLAVELEVHVDLPGSSSQVSVPGSPV